MSEQLKKLQQCFDKHYEAQWPHCPTYQEDMTPENLRDVLLRVLAEVLTEKAESDA